MTSEVRYLHEHPHIETMLLRKGIHPLNEDELLEVCDIALSSHRFGDDRSSRNAALSSFDHFAAGHILIGLELLGVQKIGQEGFEAQNRVLKDPRAIILAQALKKFSVNNS